MTCPLQGRPGDGCCPEDHVCCYDQGGNPTDCCIPDSAWHECRNGECVDPCQDVVGCSDKCCQRTGQGDCCGSLCCTPDQVCDKSRGICCPPDSEDTCLAPDRACAEKVETDVREYVVKYCDKTSRAGSPDSLTTDAFAEMGCHTFAQTVLRHHGLQTPAGDYGGLDRCSKVRDESKCGSVGCSQSTNTCRRCGGGALTSWNAFDVGSADYARDEHYATTAATPGSVRAIRSKLRGSRRGLSKHAARVRTLSRANSFDYDQPSLQSALIAYRRDVVKLRTSIARVKPKDRRGRTARKHTLAALDAFAANLKSYATGVGTVDPAKSVAAGKAGRTASKRGATAATRARRALGCGRRC